MTRALTAALLISSFALAAAAGAPSSGVSTNIQNSIERAAPNGANAKDRSLIVKAEVLLDRANFSPSEIDGLDGDNFRSAIRAFQEVNGLPTTANLDVGTWNALVGKDAAPVLKSYTISDADVAGPFTKAIPADLAEMAKLPGLSYVRPISEIAEKFHMSQTLMRQLNPGADFARAGTAILVANVSEMKLRSGGRTVEAAPPTEAVSRIATTIVIDKPAHNVRAYDHAGRLLAFYAATMGSEEKPAPSGVFKVTGVNWNPRYYYDPKFAWKEVKVDQRLTVAPGPNNPVGLVWIDLTAPSYGIHGTPAPDDIGKTQSHGCVRLTNWDVVDLAAMVRRGTTVRFEDEDTPLAMTTDPTSER